MKLKPTLAASLFAMVAAISLNASAATDTPADAKMEKPAPHMQKAASQKKMRPHSHAEEKTGVAQRAPTAKPEHPNAAKDETKHFHPRDGK